MSRVSNEISLIHWASNFLLATGSGLGLCSLLPLRPADEPALWVILKWNTSYRSRLSLPLILFFLFSLWIQTSVGLKIVQCQVAFLSLEAGTWFLSLTLLSFLFDIKERGNTAGSMFDCASRWISEPWLRSELSQKLYRWVILVPLLKELHVGV